MQCVTVWVQLQFVITVHNRCLQVHTWAWWRSWTTCKHWASMLLSCCLSRNSMSSSIIRCSPELPTSLTPAQNRSHIRSQHHLQQTGIPKAFLCTMVRLDSCPACINRCATQLTGSTASSTSLHTQKHDMEFKHGSSNSMQDITHLHCLCS